MPTPENKAKPKEAGDILQLWRFSNIETETVQWLWPNWIPLGAITLLDGDPDLGKSTVLIDIAARVSTDGEMPDGSSGCQGCVLYMAGEDDIAATIKPRLIAAGADLDRIRPLDHFLRIHDDKDASAERIDIEIPRDLHMLHQAIVSTASKLVIIDPLMGFLCGADTHKDQEVRRVLRKIRTLAEHTACAIVCLRHLNKAGVGQAMYRGGGSIGFIGAARAGLLIAKHPDDDRQRVLAQVKWNLGPKQPSLTYQLTPTEGNVCFVAWGETCEYQADQLVSQPRTEDEKDAVEEKRTLVEEAEAWLTQYLATGPRSCLECRLEAKAEGFQDRTLRKAARKVCGKFFMDEGQRKWALKAPPATCQMPDDASPQDNAS